MLKKSLVSICFAVVIAALLFFLGIFVGVYRIFPYAEIRYVANLLASDVSRNLRNNETRLGIFEEFTRPVQWVFVGDSLTERGEWGDFFPNISVANRGVASDRTADVMRRLDSIFSLSPDYAFLMLGINDVYDEVDPTDIVDSYRAIVEALKARGIKVVIQSTIQCQRSKCGRVRVNKVNSLNAKLQLLAESQGVGFISLGELSKADGLPERYTSDGVHLNAAGYRSWIESLRLRMGLAAKRS